MTPQDQHSSPRTCPQCATANDGALALSTRGDNLSDNNGLSRSALPLSETARRRESYELLALARLTVPFTATAFCMHSFRAGELAVVQRGDGRAGYRGFRRCGSRWACPVCSRRAAAIDMARTLRCFRAALEAGHALLRATFTLRHDAAMPLAESMEVLSKAQALMFSGRWWQSFRERYSVGERAYGLEVTHGAYGWHPHRHTVIELCAPPALRTVHQRRAYAARLRAELEARWLEALQKVGGSRFVGLVGLAVKVDVVGADGDDAEATARYITKYAMETTQRVAKKGRRGNLSPWEILRSGHDKGLSHGQRMRYRGLFREYAAATHRKRGVWLSKGWARMAPEPTQAALQADDPGRVVLPLSDDEGRILRALRLQATLLERVEREGPELAAAWLRTLRYDGLHARYSRPFRSAPAGVPELGGRLMDWEWGAGPVPGPAAARRRGRARAAPAPAPPGDDDF